MSGSAMRGMLGVMEEDGEMMARERHSHEVGYLLGDQG